MIDNMKKFIVVQEDDGLFNLFGREMFNENGYLWEYDGVEGYHFDDFDIVAEFDTLEEAIKFTERYE